MSSYQKFDKILRNQVYYNNSITENRKQTFL